MKILIIEDDKLPDYKDIERCIKRCLPKSKINHLTSFSEIDNISCIVNEYKLCITDILEHEGRIDNFNSPEFHYIFKKGINKISELYQRLKCPFIIITKIPVIVLEEQFMEMESCPEVHALFGDQLPRLQKELEYGKSALLTIYKQGNIHIVAKPYDQDGIPTGDFGWWLKELGETVSEYCIT